MKASYFTQQTIILCLTVIFLVACQGKNKRNDVEHDSQMENALVGKWSTSQQKDSYYMLDFSKHHLVRCREFVDGKQKKDKTYSYSCCHDNLILGYMFTGEEYETVTIVDYSSSKLVLRGWPKWGKCTFIKQ